MLSGSAKTIDQAPQASGNLLGELGEAILRTIWQLVVLLARHPLITVPLAVVAGIVFLAGPAYVVAFLVFVVAILAFWRMMEPASFAHVVSEPSRRAVRRQQRYGRCWARVMRGCGLTSVYDGKESVPRIRGFEQHPHDDRVTVQLLPGQHIGHFEKVADSLAAGFDAIECRVQRDGHKTGLPRTDRVVLAFKTGEALAETIGALPIPGEGAVGALPKPQRRSRRDA